MVALTYVVCITALALTIFASLTSSTFGVASRHPKLAFIVFFLSLWGGSAWVGFIVWQHFAGYVNLSYDPQQTFLIWGATTLCLTCTYLVLIYAVVAIIDACDVADVGKAVVAGLVTVIGLVGSIITIIEYFSSH